MTERATKTSKAERKNAVPLIVEQHPIEYTGFPFITLVQYRSQPLLAVIDNADGDVVRAFILDMCGPESVSEDTIVNVVSDWYENNRANYPISIEFSKRGMTAMTSKIYRVLSMEFVSRVIGPMPVYPMSQVKSIKRRRRKTLAPSIEIVRKQTTVAYDPLIS